MSTNFYADRATAFFNGTAVANLKSLKITIDEAVSVVETMTKDKISSGYKSGNKKVTGSFEFAIPDNSPSPDLSFLKGQDVTFIGQFGVAGDRFTVKGFQQSNQDLSGSVGEAGKTISFLALNCINEGGPGVNSPLGF